MRTISRAQARQETRRLWEKLQTVQKNEEAWAIIQDAFDEAASPCRCHIGKRYSLDNRCDGSCREESVGEMCRTSR